MRFKATANLGIPYRRGEKKQGHLLSIDSIDILGLTLHYLNSFGRQFELYGIFGLVPSSVLVWVEYGSSVLLKTLRERPVLQLRTA